MKLAGFIHVQGSNQGIGTPGTCSPSPYVRPTPGHRARTPVHFQKKPATCGRKSAHWYRAKTFTKPLSTESEDMDTGYSSNGYEALGDSALIGKARDYGQRYRKGDPRAASELRKIFRGAKRLRILDQAEAYAQIRLVDLP